MLLESTSTRSNDAALDEERQSTSQHSLHSRQRAHFRSLSFERDQPPSLGPLLFPPVYTHSQDDPPPPGPAFPRTHWPPGRQLSTSPASPASTPSGIGPRVAEQRTMTCAAVWLVTFGFDPAPPHAVNPNITTPTYRPYFIGDLLSNHQIKLKHSFLLQLKVSKTNQHFRRTSRFPKMDPKNSVEIRCPSPLSMLAERRSDCTSMDHPPGLS